MLANVAAMTRGRKFSGFHQFIGSDMAAHRLQRRRHTVIQKRGGGKEGRGGDEVYGEVAAVTGYVREKHFGFALMHMSFEKANTITYSLYLNDTPTQSHSLYVFHKILMHDHKDMR